MDLTAFEKTAKSEDVKRVIRDRILEKMIDGKMKKKNPHPTSSPYLVYATNNVFSVYNCIEYTSGGLISKRQILLKFSSK